MIALPEWLGNLTSLQELYIVDCKNLVHLPTKETMQRFTELKMLIHIKLNWCIECEEVPTLGHLPCLRVLKIYGMENVRSIGSGFYSYNDGSYKNTTTLFPASRILKLKEMYNLKEWKDAMELTSTDEVLTVFPSLEELTLHDCPNLSSLPGVPSVI